MEAFRNCGRFVPVVVCVVNFECEAAAVCDVILEVNHVMYPYDLKA